MSFKLVTWNMQGNNDDKYASIVNWLSVGGVDVVCLQEASDFFKQQNITHTDGNGVSIGTYKYGRGEPANFVYYPFGTGNERCSLGIIYKKGTGNYDTIFFKNSDTLRPLLGIEYDKDKYIYNIHAPASSGSASVANCLMGNITAKQWLCAGDFNAEPDNLQSNSYFNKNWVVNNGTFITKISDPSKDKIYDYMVSNFKSTQNIDKPFGEISDHVPVQFTVSF